MGIWDKRRERKVTEGGREDRNGGGEGDGGCEGGERARWECRKGISKEKKINFTLLDKSCDHTVPSCQLSLHGLILRGTRGG